MSNAVIILGSSRSNGETARAVQSAFEEYDVPIIDLNKYNISPFDYDHENRDDDFLNVIQKLKGVEKIVFATPVYWYAMSARLKIFFDRLSDLITIEKPVGRSLAGKQAWLIATGTDETLPPGFEIPFERTCRYFDMSFNGSCYLYTDHDGALREKTSKMLKPFVQNLIGMET